MIDDDLEFQYKSSERLAPYEEDELRKNLTKMRGPNELQIERSEHQKAKYKELLEEIYYLSFSKRPEKNYTYKDDFRPYVFFYKFLAKRPDSCTKSTINRLKLWIPDTILTMESDNPPMWIYSSPEGYVYRSDTFTSKQIQNKLGSFASSDEVVAVVKKPSFRDYAYVGNEIRILTLLDLSSAAQGVMTHRGELTCVQKFVKSIGPKPFICRTCWRRTRNPYSWVITNKNDFESSDKVPELQRFTVNPRLMGSCTVVHTIRGRYVEDTTPYLANIVKYLEHHIPGLRFEEFIGDFIKDESEVWWLVNIRGFKLVDQEAIFQPRAFLGLSIEESEEGTVVQKKERKPDDYQKVGMCKYCEIWYTVDELVHTLTLKSIIQVDKHLLHRGYKFDWLKRSDIKTLETTTLYGEHKVCNSCYKLYEETENFRLVEYELAKAMGIPTSFDNRVDQVSVMTYVPTTDEESNTTKTSIEIGPNVKKTLYIVDGEPKIIEQTAKPLKLRRYMIMLYLHQLYNVPNDIDKTKKYSIEYSLFHQVQRYEIDMSQSFTYQQENLVPLNKLRVFYFFSMENEALNPKDKGGEEEFSRESREKVNEFIIGQKTVTINLYCGDDKLGKTEVELKDFLSSNVINRQMLKLFSGKHIPTLAWGMKLTIGLTKGGEESLANMRLTSHYDAVYTTLPDYYSPDGLPREWLETYEEATKTMEKMWMKSESSKSRKM